MPEPRDAFARALERFRLGYGGEPDLGDPEDLHALGALAREEVEADADRGVVGLLEQRTMRLREVRP